MWNKPNKKSKTRKFTQFTPEYMLKWWWWSKILTDTFNKIQKHIDKWGYPYTLNIYYIKEKYGWLRVEYSWADKCVSDLIIELELLSEETCDVCWNKGKTRYDLWRYRTLCFKHYLPLKIRLIWRKLKNIL